MDKTVNTHASNSVLAKQSLPLPRTLFSEGGSVVFSELLAESTFRPERFAFDLGTNKTPSPQRISQTTKSSENPQDCRNCQQDLEKDILQKETLQKETLRNLNEQRAQNNASREAQERAQGAQQARAQQARDNQAQQEQQYRSEQIDRIASQQQNSLDKQREERSVASRSSDENTPRTRNEARNEASQARRDEEKTSARAERAQAASDNNRRDNDNNVGNQAGKLNNADTHAKTLVQEDKPKEGESKSTPLESTKDGIATKNSQADSTTNDKETTKQVTQTTPAPEENKASAQNLAEKTLLANSEEGKATTGKAENSLENALAGLGDAEGIDVFALQDKHAKTTQIASKTAETLVRFSRTQAGGLVGDADNKQQTGAISDVIATRTTAESEEGGATPTPASQEGEALAVQEGNGQNSPKDADTAKASTVSATTSPLASNAAASSTDALKAAVRDNSARLLAQAQQLGSRTADTSPADTREVNTRTTDTRGADTRTTDARAEDARVAGTRAERQAGLASPTGDQSLLRNSALEQHLRQAAAGRAAETTQQAGGKTATADAPSRSAQANAQANILAQALSTTATRATQGTSAQGKAAETPSLPESIDVRLTQEVRAHRPEGLRLSAQNAFDSLRPANSAAQTTGYGNAANGISSSTSGAASLEGKTSSALSGSDTAQAGLVSSSAAAKLAARVAERQEGLRERREASSSTTKDKPNGTQALLQSLASRLTGGRGEAASNLGGNTGQDGGSRAAQTLGQALGQLSGSSAQGSNSQGSNSDASLNNGFSQSLPGQSASNSNAARGSASSSFTTASSFVREQVFVNIQRAVEGKVESLTVKLRPELLGRIEIRLDGDAAGRLQIVVLAERSETLDLLQRDARQLEQALQDAGIRTQDQGLQFGLKGQGNAQTEGEAQRQGETASSDTTSGAEADDGEGGELGEETLSSVVDRLQVRQDGRLNVEI